MIVRPTQVDIDLAKGEQYRNIDPDNPIKEDQLPEERCEILRFAMKETSRGEALANTAVVFWLSIAIALLGLSPGFPGIGLVFVGLAAIPALLMDGLWLGTGRAGLTTIGILVLLIGVAFFPPLQIVLCPVAAVIGLYQFSIAFAEHNITFQMASPVRLPDANRMRANLMRSVRRRCVLLAVCLSLTATGTAFLWLAGSTHLGLDDEALLKARIVGLVPLGLALVLGLVLAIRSDSMAFCEGFHSWCSYNLRDRNLPGILQSPIGPTNTRRALTLSVAAVVGGGLSLLGYGFDSESPATVLGLGLRILLVCSPFLVMYGFALLATSESISEAKRFRSEVLEDPTVAPWQNVVNDLNDARAPFDRQIAELQREHAALGPVELNRLVDTQVISKMPLELQSLWVGNNAFDGSAILVPMDDIFQHMDIAGDSGAGKSSRGLLPLIAQVLGAGRCSVIVLDGKGDTLELLEVLYHVRNLLAARNIDLQVKAFSNRSRDRSHVFNPLSGQPHYRMLTSDERAALMNDGLGCSYGTEFGEAWFSANNSFVMREAFRFAEKGGKLVANFDGLRETMFDSLEAGAERMERAKREVDGMHPILEVDGLSQVHSINYVDESDSGSEAWESRIVLEDVFRQPSAFYFRLPNSETSPKIARMVLHNLLSAAEQLGPRERAYPCLCILDEFQDFAAGSIEPLLRKARSLNVGLVLSHQSMQGLRSGKVDMLTTVESVVKTRMWFGQSVGEDAERIEKLSGTTKYFDASRQYSLNGWSGEVQQTGLTVSENVGPRLPKARVAKMGARAEQGVYWIRGNSGYAQYDGQVFIGEFMHHQSKDSYEESRHFEWPDEPGMISNSRPHSDGESGPDSSDDGPGGASGPEGDSGSDGSSGLNFSSLRFGTRKK